MTTKLELAIAALEGLTEAELIGINKRVVARIRELHARHQELSLRAFHVGDRVGWTAPGYGELTGKVTRCNRKTATVLADESRDGFVGLEWRVSPTLLRRLDEVRP